MVLDLRESTAYDGRRLACGERVLEVELPPSPSNRIRLEGTPVELDELLRPLARYALTCLGLIGTGVLVYLKSILLAPLPLAFSFVAYELYFWRRGDRPIRFEVDPQAITLTDASADRTRTVLLDEIEVAVVHHRARDAHRHEAVLVLYGKDRILLAMRFLVEPTTRWLSHDIDVDELDELIGGYAGLYRALAPPNLRCRQTIDDPAAQALRFLRGCLPPEVWGRSAARVWRGKAPPCDAFGLHFGTPDGLLVIDADTWRLNLTGEPPRTGPVTLLRSARAERALLLARPGTTEIEPEEVVLPMLLIELDPEVTFTLPAPVAELSGQHRELDEGMLHTHLPEGAALLWQVLRRWPVAAWPAPLRQRARSRTEELVGARPQRTPADGARR